MWVNLLFSFQTKLYFAIKSAIQAETSQPDSYSSALYCQLHTRYLRGFKLPDLPLQFLVRIHQKDAEGNLHPAATAWKSLHDRFVQVISVESIYK